MNCERFTPYLAGYAGDDLRPDTARIISAHLDGCARCSSEVVQQRGVVKGLRSLNVVSLPTPAGLNEDVLAAVAGHRKLGTVAASMPLAVTERVLKVATDPRLADAAVQVSGASKRLGRKLADPKTGAAAAAGAAAIAGGIVALASRRRRAARNAAPA